MIPDNAFARFLKKLGDTPVIIDVTTRNGLKCRGANPLYLMRLRLLQTPALMWLREKYGTDKA